MSDAGTYLIRGVFVLSRMKVTMLNGCCDIIAV